MKYPILSSRQRSQKNAPERGPNRVSEPLKLAIRKPKMAIWNLEIAIWKFQFVIKKLKMMIL